MSTERSSGSPIWLKLVVPASFLTSVWILLPSFLTLSSGSGCACPQPEAGSFIEDMNQIQQAYYLETNKFFTEVSDFEKLGHWIPQETKKFRYIIPEVPLDYRGIPNAKKPIVTVSIAVPKDLTRKSYVGIVWTPQGRDDKTQESAPTTMAVLCKADEYGMTEAPTPLSGKEKRDVWADFLGSFSHRTQESPSFKQATSIAPVHDKNGLLKEIPCPQGFTKY